MCKYMQHICMHVLHMGANPGVFVVQWSCSPVAEVAISTWPPEVSSSSATCCASAALGAPEARWGMVSTTRNRKKRQDPGKKTWRRNIETYWNYNNESGSLIDINPSYQKLTSGKTVGKQSNETGNKNTTRAVGHSWPASTWILLLLPWHPRSSPRTWTWPHDPNERWMRWRCWELAESLCWRPQLSTDRRPAIILDLCILGVQK